MLPHHNDHDRRASLLRFCREHPVAAFLTLFFIMMVGVCLSALHRTGTDRLLLGPWSHLSW